MLFFTIPYPPLLSIVESTFSLYFGEKKFFRLKVGTGTIVLTKVHHPCLGPYFLKNEQDRSKLSFYIFARRLLYLLNVLISNLGERITILSESNKTNTCYS